jgi:hypothetical protein
MTSETKTFVQIKDIAGIEVECQRCGVTTLYPIHPISATVTEKSTEILPRCACRHDLFDVAPVAASSHYVPFPSYPAIDDLHNIASHLRSLVQTRTDIHANVRFRIDAELREGE